MAGQLAHEPPLQGGLDDATWAPISAWLVQSVDRLAAQARTSRRPDWEIDQSYRALRETALLLGDLLLAGTEMPDFAGNMETVEGYLAPWFPGEAGRLFPRLMETAERLHRARAPSAVAAAALAQVLQQAFGGS